MPCNCDHLNANQLEIEGSKVACLLDELEGKEFEKGDWKGYHPEVYCKADRDKIDKMTATLCEKLQSVDVTKYSLEMQIWWRDHQKADRKKALEKLTPHEKELMVGDLLATLKFYADNENWKLAETDIGMMPSDVDMDHGRKAREALERFEGGNNG